MQTADLARDMGEHARRVNGELREAERRMETRLKETRLIGDRLTEQLDVTRDQVGLPWMSGRAAVHEAPQHGKAAQSRAWHEHRT